MRDYLAFLVNSMLLKWSEQGEGKKDMRAEWNSLQP